MKGLIKRILREEQKGTYHREGDIEEWRINPYEKETTDLKEFLSFIDNLPDTIRELDIPTELQLFNSRRIKITPQSDKDWKKQAKDTIVSIIGEGDILSYSINSYFGTSSKDYDKHPYYISYEIPGAKEFAAQMRRGAHGSLD